MKKNLLFSFVFVCCSSVTHAQPLEPTLIEEMVRTWLDKKAVAEGVHLNLINVQAIDVGPAGIPIYKGDIFPQGYIIFTGDTRLPPLLGFSFDHNLDLSDQPENAFLALLKRDLAMLKQTLDIEEGREVAGQVIKSSDASAFVQRNEERWRMMNSQAPSMANGLSQNTDTVIGPLLETTWNQSRHYNFLSPTVEGCTDPNPYYDCKAPTGCVQTAWAQLMNYYQWPLKGVGSASYDDNSGALRGSHFAEFSDGYDWRNMRLAYTPWVDYPAVEVAAVSELMYELAVISGADFEADGTSAGYNLIGIARHLRYQPGSWVNADIVNKLRDEIQGTGPAVGSIPGHAIVMDGHRTELGDDVFHVNYGWGGANNGWYLLNAIPGGGLGIFLSGVKPTYNPIQTKTTYLPKTQDIAIKWVSPVKVKPHIQRFRILLPTYDYMPVWSDEADDLQNWRTSTWTTQIRDNRSVIYSGERPSTQLDKIIRIIPDPGAQLTLDYQSLLACNGAFDIAVSEDDQKWDNIFHEKGSDTYTPPSWKTAQLDLSAYVGKSISIRAQFVTDYTDYGPGCKWSYWYGGGIWLDRVQITNATEQGWIPENENIESTAREYTIVNAGTNVPAVRVEALVGDSWLGSSLFPVKGKGEPTTIPAAPNNLVAMPLSGGRAEIAWQDNSNNEAYFELQRKPADGQWTTISRPPRNHDGYMDSGLIAGLRYTYRVRAKNAQGRSTFSNSVTVKASP